MIYHLHYALTPEFILSSLGALTSQRSGVSGLDSSKGADSKSTPTKGGSKDGSGSPLKGGSGILVPSGPSGFFPLSTGR